MFGDSLEGLMGLSVEIYLWLGVLTAKGYIPGSAREKNVGGAWRNPCRVFLCFLSPMVGHRKRAPFSSSERYSSICAVFLPWEAH